MGSGGGSNVICNTQRKKTFHLLFRSTSGVSLYLSRIWLVHCCTPSGATLFSALLGSMSGHTDPFNGFIHLNFIYIGRVGAGARNWHAQKLQSGQSPLIEKGGLRK